MHGGISPSLWSDMSPDDVQQGSLGDCYFLSALSVLAEVPDRIHRLFILEGISEDDKSISGEELRALGCYRIRLCIGGEWKTVTIDDRLPCRLVDGELKPLFSHCHETQDFWVSLLEKVDIMPNILRHGCSSYGSMIEMNTDSLSRVTVVLGLGKVAYKLRQVRECVEEGAGSFVLCPVTFICRPWLCELG